MPDPPPVEGIMAPPAAEEGEEDDWLDAEEDVDGDDVDEWDEEGMEVAFLEMQAGLGGWAAL